MEESLIILFVLGTIVLSFFMIFLVMKFVAKSGWLKLVDQYGYPGEFNGTKMGAVSMKINTAQYGNSIIMYLGAEGMYLRPMKLFRASHPPLLISTAKINSLPGGFQNVLDTGVLVFSENPSAVVMLPSNTVRKLRIASGY